MPDPASAAQQGPPAFTPAGAGQPAGPVFAKPGAVADPSRPLFVKPGTTPGLAAAGAPSGSWQPAPGSDGFGFPAEDPVRPWPWWVGPVGLLAAVVSVVIAGIVLAAGIGIATGDVDNIDNYDYLLGLVQDVLWVGVAIAVPLVIVKWLRPEHLGLRKRHPGWAALKVVVLMFGFYVLAAIYSTALGLDDNSNQLLQDTGFGDSVWKDLAYALLYPVAAPVAEELLFRGLLFKSLRDGMRSKLGRGGAVGLAALISGAIFGAAHLGGGQDAFIPVLIGLGVLLALAYEWSGTIYVPIVIHSINNAIATGSSSDPTHDWIFAVIAAGPILSVLTAMLITRFIKRLPSTPRAAVPPSASAPPSFHPPT